MTNIKKRNQILLIIIVCLLEIMASILTKYLLSQTGDPTGDSTGDPTILFNTTIVANGIAMTLFQIFVLYLVFVILNIMAKGKYLIFDYIFIVTITVLLPLFLLRVVMMTLLCVIYWNPMAFEAHHALLMIYLCVLLAIALAIASVIYTVKLLKRNCEYGYLKSILITLSTLAIYILINQITDSFLITKF
ncbi:MAG: hypothetical protein HQM16_11240 [Deltaproteobacteria bacterium]|nr:hypothetical protein [Deltaproteobacteria bacterium]